MYEQSVFQKKTGVFLGFGAFFFLGWTDDSKLIGTKTPTIIKNNNVATEELSIQAGWDGWIAM